MPAGGTGLLSRRSFYLTGRSGFCGRTWREKILVNTAEEPLHDTVLGTLRGRGDLVLIHCSIYVERDSHKKIVIGSHAQKLKRIGTEARTEIERLLGKRVYLELFVKVKPKWRDDPRFLDTLGIELN
jgi:GTP-binding protein Era